MGHTHYHKKHYSNPPHISGKLPTSPAPQMKKQGFLGKLRERFREPPATKEEVEQLGLNTKREIYKTQMAKAKQARPSKLGNLMFSSQQPQRYGRMPRQGRREEGSFLLDSNSSDGFLSTHSSGSGLDEMVGMGKPYFGKSKKYQKSGFDEMLGL